MASDPEAKRPRRPAVPKGDVSVPAVPRPARPRAPRITPVLKDMILAALDQAGGVEYLARQADACPSAFLTLVGKVLPLQVAAQHKGEVIAHVVFKGLNDRGVDDA